MQQAVQAFNIKMIRITSLWLSIKHSHMKADNLVTTFIIHQIKNSI